MKTLGWFFLFGACLLHAQTVVNPHSALLSDFEKRVAAYAKLHKAVEAKLPALKATPSPEVVADYQHALATGIRAARQSAGQGEIFPPEIAAEFHRLIEMTMQGS